MNTHCLKTLIGTIVFILLPVYSKAQPDLFLGENVPISFYGKVVDQLGKPLAGAKVSLLVIKTHYAINGEEREPITLETGSNGEFVLTGFSGHAIDKISIEKSGYELSKKVKRTYMYSFIPTYTPDAANPVVFKMWKLAGKQRLIGSGWSGKVSEDGVTNRFDLTSGHPSGQGRLEIACTRLPKPSLLDGRFSFQCVISIAGGGIQSTTDEFTYLAPESGYAQSFAIDQKADASKWRPDVKQEFYIKTPEGNYGRLFVEWYAWQTPTGHCEWTCSVNPFGSRNLER